MNPEWGIGLVIEFPHPSDDMRVGLSQRSVALAQNL
jgi:hypothetical protein